MYYEGPPIVWGFIGLLAGLSAGILITLFVIKARRPKLFKRLIQHPKERK